VKKKILNVSFALISLLKAKPFLFLAVAVLLVGYLFGQFRYRSISAAPPGGWFLCGASTYNTGGGEQYYSTYCESPCREDENTCKNYALSERPDRAANAVSGSAFSCNTDSDCPQELACGIQYNNSAWSGIGEVKCESNQCVSKCHGSAGPASNYIDYNILARNSCYPRSKIDGQIDTVVVDGDRSGPNNFIANRFYTIQKDTFVCRNGIFNYSFNYTSELDGGEGNSGSIAVKSPTGTDLGCSIAPYKQNETVTWGDEDNEKNQPKYWHGRGCGTFYPNYNTGTFSSTTTYDSSKVERGKYGVSLHLLMTPDDVPSGSSRKVCTYLVDCNNSVATIERRDNLDPGFPDGNACEDVRGAYRVDPASVAARCNAEGKIWLDYKLQKNPAWPGAASALSTTLTFFYAQPMLDDTTTSNPLYKWRALIRQPEAKNENSGRLCQVCTNPAGCGATDNGCNINPGSGISRSGDTNISAYLETGTRTFTVGGSTEKYRIEMESETASGSCNKKSGHIINCAPDVPTPAPEGSIRVHAFEDKNNNTIQDAGEGNLAGASIKLRKGGPSPRSATSIRDQTTDGNGDTVFTALTPASDYHVFVNNAPAGYSLASSATDPQTDIAVLAGYESIRRFGFMKNSSVGGKVYFDTNFDGRISGDELYNNRSRSTLTVDIDPGAETRLSAASDYVFNNLIPGRYTISIDKGREKYAFAGGVIVGNQHVIDVSIDRTDLDFLAQPYPVGGKVYVDSNQNRQYDSGEKLIPGVTLALCERSEIGCPRLNSERSISEAGINGNIKTLTGRDYNYVLSAGSPQQWDAILEVSSIPPQYSLNPADPVTRRQPNYDSSSRLHGQSDFGLLEKGKIQGTVFKDTGFDLCRPATRTAASEIVTIRNWDNPAEQYSFGNVGAYSQGGLLGTRYEVLTTYNLANGEATVLVPGDPTFKKSPHTVYLSSGPDQTINFCISTLKEWMQTMTGDVRYAGILKGAIPPGQLASKAPQFPSVFFSSTGAVNINPSTRISATGWKAENDFNNAAVKSSSGQTSYTYYLNLIQRKGLKTETLPISCNGGTPNCSLNALNSGMYHITDGTTEKDYSLRSSSGDTIVISGNKKVILLVNGNAEILSKIRVEKGSSLILAVKKNIQISETIGAPAIADDTTTQLEGIFTAEGSITFKTQGNTCAADVADTRINIGGTLIANARQPFAKNGTGKIVNRRSLCPDGNLLHPSVKIFDRFDLITGLEDTYKNQRSIWKEVQPQ
jgi:hypothetical protein